MQNLRILWVVFYIHNCTLLVCSSLSCRLLEDLNQCCTLKVTLREKVAIVGNLNPQRSHHGVSPGECGRLMTPCGGRHKWKVPRLHKHAQPCKFTTLEAVKQVCMWVQGYLYDLNSWLTAVLFQSLATNRHYCQQ